MRGLFAGATLIGSDTSVDILRDGLRLLTTSNTGRLTDSSPKRGGGTYTYKVCEAGTSTCSSPVTVVF